MFSTGSDGGGKVVRTRRPTAMAAAADIDFAGPGGRRDACRTTYRIDWTATGFDYFVDGASVATHADRR